MNELISKEKAIEVLERAKQNIRRNIERAIGRAICEILDEVENGIKQLPPIQPVIVRCKDCKYAEYIDDVKTLWCTECGQGRTVAPNDFCSYAERREVTT